MNVAINILILMESHQENEILFVCKTEEGRGGGGMCDSKNSTQTSGKPRIECNPIWSCWQAYQALAHFGNLIYQWCRLNFGSFNQPLSQSQFNISPTKIVHYGQQQKISLLKYFLCGNILSNPKIFDVCVWMNVRDIVYTLSTQKTCLDKMI